MFEPRRVFIAAVLGAAVAGTFVPLLAHHSFQAEYDEAKPLTLTGKVTRVLPDNPHGWIYLDSKNAQGRVVNWALELPPPNILRRNGFDTSVYMEMMNNGEEVTVTAFAAKDGSKHAWAGGLTRADGKTVIPLGGIPQQGPGGFKGKGFPGQ